MPLPTNPGSVGTPDYTRGVVSPQKVVGDFGEVASGTVGVPLNSQSLLVFAKGPAQDFQLSTVVGVTTGYSYGFQATDFPTSPPYDSTYVVLVTPGVDEQVSLRWTGAPPDGWVVVSDQGVRQVVDSTLYALAAENGLPAAGAGLAIFGTDGTDNRQLLTDNHGRLLPSAPTISTGVVTVANGGVILAAPTTGTNYIFGIRAWSASADIAEIHAGGAAIAAVSYPGGNIVGADDAEGFATTMALTYTALTVNQDANFLVRYANG